MGMVVELGKLLPNRENKKYVIGMDNYFTLPKAIKGLRDLGIACVGTARVRIVWTPKEVIEVSDNRFNNFYQLNNSLEHFYR